MLLDKLESGVVALQTERGPVYVQPSGWQKLYMVWTFRHFSSLPLKTLNSRQRRMVEGLPRCGVRVHGPDRIQVIGTVEGASIASLQAARQIKESVQAMPIEDVSIPAVLPELVPSITTEDREIRRHPLRASKLVLTMAAATLSALAVIAPWQRLPLREIFTAATVEHSKPEIKSPSVELPAQSEANQASSRNPVSQDIQTPELTKPLELPSATPLRVEDALPKPTVVNGTTTPPAVSAIEETQISKTLSKVSSGLAAAEKKPILASIHEQEVVETNQRMEVSGPPRNIVYPEYPQTTARGKVILKAVIGIDGRVRDITILSGNKALSAAAVRAVRQWRYNPFYKDGAPVETETKVGVVFVATDAISITFPAAVPIAR